MLSIHWIQDVDYYLDQATADYYFRPGEPPGRWWGEGAKRLGLRGTVTAQQLKALCKGYAPAGNALIQNAGAKDHQQAWDLTFSAPKTVSILWTQAPREIRLRIRKLHHRAIKAALDYLTDAAILTRRGKGGTIRERAEPIVAIFEHGSNRELEPQLHSHCVLVNVAGRADGSFGTILSDPFYNHKMTAGSLYRAHLAHLLRNELGLEIERQDVAFGITGVPQKLVDHYSTRRKQIKGKLGPRGTHSAKAAATAALDTRKTKRNPPPPRAVLLSRWQNTNSRFGFLETVAKGLLGRITSKTSHQDLRKYVSQVIDDLLESEAYFSEQQVIRGVAIAAVADGVSATNVIDEARDYLASDSEILTLGAERNEPLFTTRKMWALEKKLFAAIREGRADTCHVVGEATVEHLVDQQLPLGPFLTDDEVARNKEQRQAVMALTTAPGDVQVMEGMAGTGKTYTLSVARQAWEEAGLHVTGLALSAVAAANLQQGSGIESDTLAMRLLQLDGRGSLAHHHKRQLKRLARGNRTYAYSGRRFRLTRNTVVVLDEAGMVGTKQMVRLLKHVRKAGAKLVLVGDRRQLQPVEAGGPLTPLAKAYKSADLEHVTRQKVEPHDPNPTWHREAGRLIAAGAVARSVKLFAERGRLSVVADREQAMLSIVRDWSVEGIARPNEHVVLAATRAEVLQLNAMCQSARLSAGALATECCEVADLTVFRGDIVLFTKNSRLYQVKNGDRGEVLGFNHLSRTMAVRLHQSDKTVYIPYRNYKEVQLGYAMTTHKAQGATVPSVYVLLGGPMQDRHLSYVQATRACHSTRLYLDRTNAGPKLKHLLNHMERARPKRLAHDVLKPSGSGPTTKPPTSTKTPPDSKTPLSQPTPNRAASTTDEKRGHVQPRKAKPASNRTPSHSGRSRKVQAHKDNPAPQATPATGAVPPQRNTTAPRVNLSSGEGRPSPAPSRDQHDGQTPKTHDPLPSAPAPRLRRNVQDVSHVRIRPSTDLELLKGAVKRYGRLPGGIILEGEADCDLTITSLAIDPQRPGCLVINGSLLFDTGLSAEEVALLWHAVLETGRAATDFAAVSQHDVIGIANDTVVATVMMQADNALGRLVYGFDSMFRLAEVSVPNYVNPFLAEAETASRRERLELMAFNHLHRIHPQFFLKVSGARFEVAETGVLKAASLSVTAPIGVVNEEGAIVSSLAKFSQNGPLVTQRFPWVYRAFVDMNAHFSDYAQTDSSIARAFAYVELVLLLRRAKRSGASLDGQEHVRSCLAKRQCVSIPKYNFTSRDSQYTSVAAQTARRLSKIVATDSCDRLIAVLVGLEYAARAGDVHAFLDCKRSALDCIKHLDGVALEAHAPAYHREIRRALPVVEEILHNRAHDQLIDNCLSAALVASCTSEQREAYLQQALGLCESASAPTKHLGTRCRWLEAKSHLDPTFDSVPDLSSIRAQEPRAIQPFFTLNRIVHLKLGIGVNSTTRDVLLAIEQQKHALGFDQLSSEDAALWSRLESDQSEQQILWLLHELRRFRISITDYLSTSRRDAASRPGQVLAKIIVRRLSPLPAPQFSTHYLHRENPFAGSHALLDFETPESIASMFTLVRSQVETFGMSEHRTGASLRKFFSTLRGNGVEAWWQQLLKLHAPTPDQDASKVALLLAHELRIRGQNVGQLYDEMQKHDTENSQAGLFLLDLEKAARRPS